MPALNGDSQNIRQHMILLIGQRVRQGRLERGISQEKLGEMLGLTFQQIQKYEKGANRIGPERLYLCSKIFDVPIDFFFEDLKGLDIESPVEIPFKPIVELTPQQHRAIRALQRITDHRVSKRLMNLIVSLGGEACEIMPPACESPEPEIPAALSKSKKTKTSKKKRLT